MNSDKFSSEPRAKTASDLIRVLDTGETIEALGLSRRTWERLVQLGDTPVKTRLSEGRIGYRVTDIAAWLDRRRETGRGGAMSKELRFALLDLIWSGSLDALRAAYRKLDQSNQLTAHEREVAANLMNEPVHAWALEANSTP